MSLSSDRLRFLWEEEMAPPEEARGPGGRESTGVPRFLRQLTQSALIGVVATSLLGSIVGVRLVAPVDADPSYHAQCVQACNAQHDQDHAACMQLPPGNQRGQCEAAAAQKMQQCKASCGNGP